MTFLSQGVGHVINDYEELKRAIIDACLSLEARGDIIGTYGNGSARVPEGLIVTPSRVNYHEITPEDMVVVSPQGHRLAGQHLAAGQRQKRGPSQCPFYCTGKPVPGN